MSGVDSCTPTVVKKLASTYKPRNYENQSHIFFHNMVVHIQVYAQNLKIEKDEFHKHIELMKELRQLHFEIRRDPTLYDITDWDYDVLRNELYNDEVTHKCIDFVIDLEDYISTISLPLCENITSSVIQSFLHQ